MTRSDTTDGTCELQVICTVSTPELCYFRHTLEAYEGLCVPTTLPGGQGRVRLATSAAQRARLATVLAALATEIPLQVGPWAPPQRSGVEVRDAG